MPRTALALAALLIATAAAPAAAQSAGYLSASKTQAILGGESRLAAIMAQQSGQVIGQAQQIAPSGYSTHMMPAAMHLVRPAIAMDRPDVFNSVALPIDRTSLDRRWRKVAKGAISKPAASYAAALDGQSDLAKVEAVNRYVNQRVNFVDDKRQYGVTDHWSPAAETLRRGRGDCEDYAIAKLQLLRRAGFAESDLYLVILRDALRRSDHAVLVVRAEGRLLVLDNGTERLIDSYDMPDYRPIVSFSGNQAWTHGYRRELPPVVVASNEESIPAVTLTAASAMAAPPAPSALR